MENWDRLNWIELCKFLHLLHDVECSFLTYSTVGVLITFITGGGGGVSQLSRVC